MLFRSNYINNTVSALELIEKVDSKGFLLNLDVGTMIQNDESVWELVGKVHMINHVHISEPGLKPVEERQLHSDLKQVLLDENYKGFISIEMGKIDELSIIENKICYVRKIFNQ